jgi:ferrous iron transport protein B
LGRPLILALNMMDIAQKRGCQISVEALSRQLGIPVVTTVAMRKSGVRDLLESDRYVAGPDPGGKGDATATDAWVEPSPEAIRAYHREVERNCCARRLSRKARRSASLGKWIESYCIRWPGR